MAGDLHQAGKYYERVIAETVPTPEDYLNMGHLKLAEGKFLPYLYIISIIDFGYLSPYRIASVSRGTRSL